MQSIKILPKEGIFSYDKKIEEKEDCVTINYVGYDKDKDPWNLGFTKAFILSLNQESIESIQNHKEINDKTDAESLLNEFYKTNKLSIKNKKILYIDIVFVDMIFRGNGLAKKFINDIIEYAKANSIEYLLLKAHPFITWRHGIVRVQKDKQIREDRKRLHKLYSNLGFEELKQRSDSMFYEVLK